MGKRRIISAPTVSVVAERAIYIPDQLTSLRTIPAGKDMRTNYEAPTLTAYGTIASLTSNGRAKGKWNGGSDGQSGIDGLANSKCPGGSDGSNSTHNDAENPLLCYS